MKCAIANWDFSFTIHNSQFTIELSGGYDEKVTPVPIPNTAVKLLSADDTWLVTARKSRSPPDLYQTPVLQ